MSNALVSMADMEKIAKSLVTSKMFGFKTEAEAMAIMLIAQAEGRSPALAARDYHVIQGRPALKADAMLARFQQEGGVVEWVTYTDEKVSGKFSHPKSCPVPVEITWTMDIAKRAGIAARDNWQHYPRAMLRSRVISEGVRATFPGIAIGLLTVEEAQDEHIEKDITPAGGVVQQLSEEERVKVSELADRMREWLLQGSLTDAHAEMDNAALCAEEHIFLWTHFDSKIRRQLKEEGERQQTKRKLLESKPNVAAPKPPETVTSGEELHASPSTSEAATTVSVDQAIELADLFTEKGWNKDKFLTKHGIKNFEQVTIEQYEQAKAA